MEKTKKIDQLSGKELKDVKGGIPYETPVLFELSTESTSCTVGIHCDSGHNGGSQCHTGTTCSSGTHGPTTDIEPV